MRGRFLSDAELARFLAVVRERRHVHQPRDHALFALLSNTGIRPSEALQLAASDLHLAGKDPWIRVRRLKKKSLLPQYDELQIPVELAATLEAHARALEPGARVFGIDGHQARKLFQFYRRAAGIKRRLWLYCLRHTAATRIYRATRNIATVQAILGHERADMSCLYAQITREVQRATLAAVPATT